MIPCPPAGPLIEYAHGDLDDEGERLRVEAHLHACAGCRADVLLHRKIRSLAARLPPSPPPLMVLGHLEAALGETR
jgi:anti-sigma factor RsiW